MPCQVGDEKNIGDLHVNADNHVKLGISARYVLAFLILTILIASSFLLSIFFLLLRLNASHYQFQLLITKWNEERSTRNHKLHL